MGTPAIVAWGLTALCLGLIALAHCIPVEIVYTGEGCDCPSKLDYLINIPRVPRAKKYTLGEYGYKVEVPTPPPVHVKEKVSYSFDFTVEEPRAPKPEKTPRWTLFAKVDRVAINKGDCEDNYVPPPPSPPPCSRCGYSCSCGKSCGCGKPTRPIYGYVYKEVLPRCKGQRGNCKCNLMKRTLSPNAIDSANFVRIRPSTSVPIAPLESDGSSIRRKRDLHHFFFRPRKLQLHQRPARYVKYYHKTLPRKRQATLFDLDSFVAPPMSLKSKRKFKKMLLPQGLHGRIVKRDIKGEFELLEKEREQMDLTLPEIIQYMPETLQPNFKRGQCYFGCASRQPQVSSSSFNFSDIQDTLQDQPSQNNDGPTSKSGSTEDTKQQTQPNDSNDPSQNLVTSTTYTKRNAANYNFGIAATQLPSFLPAQSAYAAQLPPSSPSHISAKPIYDSQQQIAAAPPQQSAYSASSKLAEPLQYAYDRLGHKYIERNSRLRLVVPDPVDGADSVPLQYVGDLEKTSPLYRSPTHEKTTIVGAPNYPVQHISSDHLDSIISQIIYRHPDFIDATAHYGGALVDPEPWQEQETRQFLKKLIDGRLSLWFGFDGSQEPDDSPFYTSSYSNPFNPYSLPPPILGFYPSAY